MTAVITCYVLYLVAWFAPIPWLSGSKQHYARYFIEGYASGVLFLLCVGGVFWFEFSPFARRSKLVGLAWFAAALGAVRGFLMPAAAS